MPLAVGFGWLLAPYYWNLLSKPYILRCRSFQMRTFLYVDDQLGGNKDKKRAQAEYHLAKATMEHFGFAPAPDKGQAVVAQDVEHLGYELSTPDDMPGMYILPEGKECAIARMAKQILATAYSGRRWVQGRSVRTLFQTMNAASLACQQARFRTRAMISCCARHGCFEGRGNWGIQVKLDRRALGECQWLADIRIRRARRTIWRRPVTEVIATDASLEGHLPSRPTASGRREGGWGAVLFRRGGRCLSMSPATQAAVLAFGPATTHPK